VLKFSKRKLRQCKIMYAPYAVSGYVFLLSSDHKAFFTVRLLNL